MTPSYRVGFLPQKHLFQVTLTLDGCDGKPFELWLAAWTPGSYLIREFARHVQGLRAFTSDGAALPITRKTKDAWHVDACGNGLLRIEYQVYANDLSVRTSHLDQTHGYFNGATLFLTNETLAGRPATLALDLPPGWEAITALRLEPDGLYRAKDFDELCDSPVECAPDDRSLAFFAAGKPHTLTMWGTGNEDLPRLASDLSRIVEQASRVFGGLPYDRYLFLALLADKGRGGLEHRESCTLLTPRFGFRPERQRQEFLFLCAHEHFHAWVVKRMRPLQLSPYRYRAESFTRLLWFFEGFTSYYETLLTLRAGLCSSARFLEILGERMTQLARTPGRKVQSLEEASLAAWVKYYRPDENSPNSSVSYYLKGSLVALQLEGELRRCGHSLDVLMRRLWERYGVNETGIPEDGIRREVEALCGEPLPLFAQVIAGTDDPDYRPLESLGLQARARPREGAQDKGGSKGKPDRADNGSALGTLGVLFKPERTVIQTVLSDGPAERAGLCADDEIIATDGFRLATDAIASRLESLQPGSIVRLSYFRRDELREADVELAERPLDTYWVDKVEDPTEAQRLAWEEWTGQPW